MLIIILIISDIIKIICDKMDRILYQSNRCKYCNNVFVNSINRTACLPCIQEKVQKEIEIIYSQVAKPTMNISICPECGTVFPHMFEDMQCADCLFHTYLGMRPFADNKYNNPFAAFYITLYQSVCPTCNSSISTFISESQCINCLISN